MTVKKFIDGADHKLVKGNDILRPGDWVLKWDPNGPVDETGYALYTPKEFDPNKGGGPLGGLLLAAVYFILEHGERSFAQDMIDRANEVAKNIREREQEQAATSMSPSGRTLN